MIAETLCMGCMQERDGAARCPYCGWVEGARPDSPIYLVPRTLLNDQYLIGRVLGHGGFGVLYLGWDSRLQRKVAVKEYMPQSIAGRAPGTTAVSVYMNQDDYDWGLDRFLDEARVVARFSDRPDIVSVINYFAANETGYMVMEFLEGQTLLQYVESKGGKISYESAQRIMMPVMDALRAIHEVGIMHRDVSPDNVFMTSAGLIKLLDFGAARQAMGQKSQNLSIILKEGYAPEEQYRSKGNQGPWTDVYATAATLYRAITGRVPPAAPDRLYEDDILPPSALGVAIPPQSEAALMQGLAVRAEARFQSVRAFQAALLSVKPVPFSHPAPERAPAPAPRPAPAPAPQPFVSPTPKPDPLAQLRASAARLPKWAWGVAAGLLLLLLALPFIGGGSDAEMDPLVVGVWRWQWTDGVRPYSCHLVYTADGRYQWLDGCPPIVSGDRGTIRMAGGSYEASSAIHNVTESGSYLLLSNTRLQMTRGNDGFITVWDKVTEQERAALDIPESFANPEEPRRAPQPSEPRTQVPETPPNRQPEAPRNQQPEAPRNSAPERPRSPQTRDQPNREVPPANSDRNYYGAVAGYEQLARNAAQALQSNRTSEAHQLLLEALEAKPDYPYANALMGLVKLYHRGDYASAARHYQIAYDGGESITFFVTHDVGNGTFDAVRPAVLNVSRSAVSLAEGRSFLFETSPSRIEEAKKKGMGGLLLKAKGVSAVFHIRTGGRLFNLAPTSNFKKEETDLILRFLGRS